jgi:hypothetical protein
MVLKQRIYNSNRGFATVDTPMVTVAVCRFKPAWEVILIGFRKFGE